MREGGTGEKEGGRVTSQPCAPLTAPSSSPTSLVWASANHLPSEAVRPAPTPRRSELPSRFLGDPSGTHSDCHPGEPNPAPTSPGPPLLLAAPSLYQPLAFPGPRFSPPTQPIDPQPGKQLQCSPPEHPSSSTASPAPVHPKPWAAQRGHFLRPHAWGPPVGTAPAAQPKPCLILPTGGQEPRGPR